MMLLSSFLNSLRLCLRHRDTHHKKYLMQMKSGILEVHAQQEIISKKGKTALGFITAKDRLTLLLCGNTADDFICKLLLVYHSQNPQVLKGHTYHTLPVNW